MVIAMRNVRDVLDMMLLSRAEIVSQYRSDKSAKANDSEVDEYIRNKPSEIAKQNSSVGREGLSLC